MANKNIVWLASYPKSGNTWFRVFLSNLRSEKAAPIDINEIQTDGIFSSKAIFEKATGIEACHLASKEADLLRPEVFRYYSSRFDDLLFIKAHDAYTFLPTGDPLFPTDVSYGAIYFVRNPLDVAVSWAFHNGNAVGNADKSINTRTIISKNRGYQSQMPQKILTWQEHILSWQNQSNIPILILRYEDMKQEPLATFKKAVEFLGWDNSDAEILEALEKSSFQKLKTQELQNRFIESKPKQGIFFRSGIVGDWENHLNEKQTDNIKKLNALVLNSFNYKF